MPALPKSERAKEKILPLPFGAYLLAGTIKRRCRPEEFVISRLHLVKLNIFDKKMWLLILLLLPPFTQCACWQENESDFHHEGDVMIASIIDAHLPTSTYDACSEQFDEANVLQSQAFLL